MQITHVTTDLCQSWNALVAQESSFALLQSCEWGEFKETLGWKSFRVAIERQGQIIAGAQMLVRPFLKGLASVAYIPRGPVGNWIGNEETTCLLLSELHRIARRHRSIFLRIEPPLLNDPVIDQVLQQYDLCPSRYTNQPRATVIVDLTQNLDRILAQMHQKTRYNIRYAARKQVVVRVGGYQDLATFNRLMQMTGRRSGFSPRGAEYYEQQWMTFAPLGRLGLFIAYYQGKALAVNISAVFGKHGAYLHGASNGGHRNLMPNYALMWEAIKWAKSQGCMTFDLWGIPEQVGLAAYNGQDLPLSNRTDDLWGVYRFKRGFSTNVAYYIGAYDYVYSPLLFGIMTNLIPSADRSERISVWVDSLKRPGAKIN